MSDADRCAVVPPGDPASRQPTVRSVGRVRRPVDPAASIELDARRPAVLDRVRAARTTSERLDVFGRRPRPRAD